MYSGQEEKKRDDITSFGVFAFASQRTTNLLPHSYAGNAKAGGSLFIYLFLGQMFIS